MEWLKEIIKEIDELASKIWHLSNELNDFNFLSKQTDYDEEIDYKEQQLDYYIRSIHNRIIFSLEKLELTRYLESYDNEFKKYKSNLSSAQYLPYIGELTVNSVDFMLEHIEPLRTLINGNSNSEYIRLEKILRSTNKMLNDRKLNPKNETQVKKVVYENLSFLFPDTVREIPIAKISKVYKPDIGIKSLKVAIEYKFVDSLNELKIAIDGIYTDIAGYSGSEDWKYFYAVIYITDTFMTEAQVEAEFKISEVKGNWKPILVLGKGKRRK